MLVTVNLGRKVNDTSCKRLNELMGSRVFFLKPNPLLRLKCFVNTLYYQQLS